jgi:hypothetical protein
MRDVETVLERIAACLRMEASAGCHLRRKLERDRRPAMLRHGVILKVVLQDGRMPVAREEPIANATMCADGPQGSGNVSSSRIMKKFTNSFLHNREAYLTRTFQAASF